jgi:CRISPR/Cas system-associated exonuclease Cas4 (RecB family)
MDDPTIAISTIAISALQHYAYCPRQFALIHIEQVWEENRFTAEGRVLHERVTHVVMNRQRRPLATSH